MSEIIRELDKNNNCIHYKDPDGHEEWCEYDEKNNIIHIKDSRGYESWAEFNENNKIIHSRNSQGKIWWGKYENEHQIEITEQEFKQIKEQEFLSREPIPRFELMEL